jgi:tetratricopeptide (TPR) repeat protein
MMSVQALYAQSSFKEIFIVDSIPLIDDPEYGDELSTDEILDIRIITNKDSLKQIGYPEFDRVTYVCTKAYKSRPDSLKRIPTTRQMVRENGRWTLNGKVYSGPFIDYYLKGYKSGEGIFKDGLLNGSRKMYYPNGNLLQDYHYTQGILDGTAKKYYADGNLAHDGEFISGKEHGLWQMYYPNKQLKQRIAFAHGVPTAEVSMYRSNGKLITVQQIKEGIGVPEKHMMNLVTAMNNGHKNKDNAALALRYYTKAIEVDSSYAEAYYSRGTSKMQLFDFDGAIADLNKALELEPYLDLAYANRAFARIRKYQFKNSRPISRNKAVTVFAESQKIDYPPGDKATIIKDLEKAYFLGDKNEQVVDALHEFSSKTPSD